MIESFKFGCFRFDLPGRRLVFLSKDRDVGIELSHGEAVVLETLLKAQTALVATKVLQERLSFEASPPGRTFTNNDVHQAISSLRLKLQKDRQGVSDLIRTVRGGYYLTATVESPRAGTISNAQRNNRIWNDYPLDRLTHIVFSNEVMFLKDSAPHTLSLTCRPGYSKAVDSYTGHGEVFGVLQLAHLFWRMGVHVNLVRSTDFEVDLMRTGNIVWLGSPFASEKLGDILGMSFWRTRCLCSFEKRTDRSSAGPGIALIKCPGVRAFNTSFWGVSKTEYGLVRSATTTFGNRFLLLAGTDTWATRMCVEFVASEDTRIGELRSEALEVCASALEFEVVIKISKGQHTATHAATIDSIVWPRSGDDSNGEPRRSRAKTKRQKKQDI